jgi:hypothetical protein
MKSGMSTRPLLHILLSLFVHMSIDRTSRSYQDQYQRHHLQGIYSFMCARISHAVQ